MQLSLRMIITYTILNIGDLLGSQLTKLVNRLWGGITAAFLMQAVNLAVIAYVLLLVPELRAGRESPGAQGAASLLREGLLAVYSSARAVLRRREGCCRFLLLCAFAVGLVNRTAFSEEKALIGTYTKLPPFNWSLADFAQYKSYRPFVRECWHPQPTC